MAFPRSSLVAVLGAAALSRATLAQPCEPQWDPAIGNPGLGDGYAGAVSAWDDGNTKAVYVGGSFTNLANESQTRLIARWTPSTGLWTSVGGGLSTGFTNGFVTSILPFTSGGNSELIVGGFFASAADVPGTKSLARWNGQAWAALGSNFDPTSASSVWTLYPWSGTGAQRLYVGGSFPFADEAVANGIAAWDGDGWHSVGSGITGPFSPTVFRISSFNDGSGDKLYAAGRFNTMNGVSAPLIARWDTVAWTRVGTNLTSGGTFAGLESLAVFDDGTGPALYAGGNELRVSGQAASVAKWNGTTWSRVGQTFTGRVTSLIVWNDGNGDELYMGGTATPGVNYFARLEGGQWVAAGGGVGGTGVPPTNFPSVFALGMVGRDLVVAGNFTEVAGEYTEGLALYRRCGNDCPADLNADGSVGLGDLTILLANFGTAADARPEDGDLDGDGDVDLSDLTVFLAEFGATCP